LPAARRYSNTPTTATTSSTPPPTHRPMTSGPDGANNDVDVLACAAATQEVNSGLVSGHAVRQPHEHAPQVDTGAGDGLAGTGVGDMAAAGLGDAAAGDGVVDEDTPTEGAGDSDGPGVDVGDAVGDAAMPVIPKSKRMPVDVVAKLCTSTASRFVPVSRPDKSVSVYLNAVANAAPTALDARVVRVTAPVPMLDLHTSLPFKYTIAPSSRTRDMFSAEYTLGFVTVNVFRKFITTLFTLEVVFSSPRPYPMGVSPDFHVVSTKLAAVHVAPGDVVESRYFHDAPRAMIDV
jgi:hypothetical protein